MYEIIKQISERLADRSSRRGFFSTIGTATAAAAALITGHGFFAQAATTHPPLHCCHVDTGIACPTTKCPAGTTQNYTWHCRHTDDSDAGDYYICHDCYKNGKLYCVYSTFHT